VETAAKDVEAEGRGLADGKRRHRILWKRKTDKTILEYSLSRSCHGNQMC